MKTKRTRWWLKSAALLCATVFGLTAFGGIHEWTPVEGGTTYWDDEANWAIGSEDWTDYRIGNNGAQVTFRSAVSEDDAYTVLFYNGEHTLVAEDASYGLSKSNALMQLHAPWWFTGAPVLNITSGTYEFGTVDLAPDGTYGGSATLNLNGGTLTAPYVTVGADCTIVLNGGTLSATTVGGAGTLSVAGGTFANGENATVSATLSGSGTLTKTGAGTLAFTGSYAAFTGKIAVAESAGSVTVGDITIAAGEEVQFGVYTWTGAAEDGLWKTPGNWLVNNAVPETLPTNDSTVIIPAGDDVTITVNGAYTGNMTINRNVKLVAENVSSSTFLYVGKVGGTGTLTLAGASSSRWLRLGIGGDYTIDCDLEIKGHVYVANGSAKTLVVNGAFMGDGTVTCNGNADAGIAFYGDTSAFAGYYEGGLRNNGNRDNTKFRDNARGSALASWHFCGYGNTLATPFEVDGVTYQFGSLNTYAGEYKRLTLAGCTSTTIEVGAKGDSNVGGTLSNNGNTLRQVGDSTALNLTLTENYGTVEAEAGTVVIYGTVAPAAVKFAGTGAKIKIARSTTTTTEVDSGVEDDESTTDVDESKTTTTTTTDNIAASFVPGFTDALVGCQYEVAQETVDNVTYDVYTVLTDVATDSAGTTYDSVALALAAIAADETETLTKTVTLAKSTTEAVTLPFGYSLALNGKTVGSVAGAAGVGVAYDEETQTWTTADNSEATWTGKAGDGLWETAGNWSTGFVPGSATKVVFNDTATVFLSGCNNYDCGEFNIAKGKTVTLAPAEYNQANWPRVRVHGDITSGGECTLKLFRCGIDNAKDDGSVVEVRPTVTFENDGEHDSWMTGSFDLRSGFTGTGLFIAYGSNGSGRLKFTTGSITVPAGSVVDFRGGNYPTYGGSGGVISAGGLNGDGRVIIHTIPGNNVDRTYFQAAFKNAERWTGTCELAGIAVNNLNFANYGNANSVVCVNGVTGYLDLPDNWGTKNVAEIKELNIAAGGLTLNGGAYSQKYYLFRSALTGSGPIAFGTSCGNVSYYVFTGDVSGFTGAINFGSLTTSNAPGVVFRTTSETSDLSAGHGTITVQKGVTLDVASTWTAPGGFKVMGTVNPSSLSVLSGSVLDVSTGTVVLPATEISTKTGLPLPALSSANGTLVIKGITRSDASKSLYLGTGATCTIAGTTQLDGDLHITDGNSNATYTWNKLTGSGAFFVTTAGGSASGITHAVTTLDNYTGTITAGGNVSLTIGTVAVDAVEVGVPVVKLAADSTLTTNPAAIVLEVAGEASELTLVKADDGNLYVAAASVTVTPEEGDSVTTPFATYEAAAAFADANGVSTFAVLYGDGAVNGWDYDSETGKLTKNATAIARVGTTQFDTLDAAFEAAGETDTVVLFGTSAEAVTVGAGQTLVVEGVYTGTLSGSGTVDAKVATTPAGFSDWTGTFVVNWNLSGTSSAKAAVVLDNYGVKGSTVRVTQALENFYFKHKDKANSADVQPAVYFEADVTQNDGYTYNYNGGLATIFSQVGMAAGKTFATRGAGGTGNKYIFTKLEGFEGTLNVRSTDIVEINGVEVAKMPAVGTKVVNATVAATASVTAQIAAGYPLVVKADGLYFDPVAQVGTVYYNTLAEAIAAANGGNTVTLVADTTDGYTLAAGDSFSIAWNGHTTGTIALPTGDYYSTESYNDETGTTAYTCTAAIGILTIGQTVTPIATAEAAFNGFMAQTTPADSTLRFFTANPLAELSVPCATYDAETLTYTKLAAVAQIGTGVAVIPYPTLAEACAAAEEYKYDTVTLLVALGEQTVPDGWDYKDPATSGTEFGTLTKEMTVTYNVWFVDTDGSTTLAEKQTVESGATATKPADPTKEGKTFVAWTLGGTAYDFSTPVTATITLMASWKDAPTGTEADDGSGNKFTVPATVATPAGKTLTDAATGTINYAQAYALGLWDGTAEGEVAAPTVSINIVNGKVQVAFAGGTVPEAYTVTTILQYKTTLGTTSEWQNVEGVGATGALGATLVDQSEMGANKFYRVIVTICDKAGDANVGNETGSGQGA